MSHVLPADNNYDPGWTKTTWIGHCSDTYDDSSTAVDQVGDIFGGGTTVDGCPIFYPMAESEAIAAAKDECACRDTCAGFDVHPDGNGKFICFRTGTDQKPPLRYSNVACYEKDPSAWPSPAPATCDTADKTDGRWFKHDVDSLDMPCPDSLPCPRTVETTAADCRARCVGIPECQYFNKFPNGGCHMAGSSATVIAVNNNPTQVAGRVRCGGTVLPYWPHGRCVRLCL